MSLSRADIEECDFCGYETNQPCSSSDQAHDCHEFKMLLWVTEEKAKRNAHV